LLTEELWHANYPLLALSTVDDCNYIRHSPRHKLEREPLRGVCGFYLRQSWNVEMASSYRELRRTLDDSPV
jgi:hypothetical protein